MQRNLKKILAVAIASAVFAGGLPAEGIAAQPDTGIVSVENDSDKEGSTEEKPTEESVHDNEREENGSISVVQDDGNESMLSDAEDAVSESVSKVDEKGESSETVEAEEEIGDEERSVKETEEQETESEESTIKELVLLSSEGTYTPEGADYSLTYKVINGTSVTITGISDQNATGELVIPSEIDGIKVTRIGDEAFKGCSGLTGKLIIPKSVTSIDYCAFGGCSGFTGELIIPEGVTTIGVDAFSGCSGFTGDLTIPTSAINIYKEAFAGCSGLTGKLIIPESVKTIYDAAFSGSSFTGELIIPSGVTNIGEYAFDGCSGFTGELTIPSGVINIERYAFYRCDSFSSVEIPESVQKIGAYAFKADKITIFGKTVDIAEKGLYEVQVIYGYSGSTAETYAKANNITFISLDGGTTEPTKPVEYKVSNVKELEDAIGSNRRIILADGVYPIEYSIWLQDITALTIEAEHDGKVELLDENSNTPVFSINNSSDIKIAGCILGHGRVAYNGPMECGPEGYIFEVFFVNGLELDKCDLYGCGIQGLYGREMENISIKNCIIRDCKEGIIYECDEFSLKNVTFNNCIISGNAYDESWENGHNHPVVNCSRDVSCSSDVSFEDCMFLNNWNTSFGVEDEAAINCTFYDNAWNGGTPQSYGICLNGITWQVEGTTLKLGYPLQLDADTVRQSEKGKVLDYSDYALPWRRFEIKEVDTAAGIEYGKNPDKPDNPDKPEDLASGSYQDMSWKIDSAGKLTVTGTGNYAGSNDAQSAPWYEYRESIKTAEVSLIDSTCAAYMFEGCKNLTELNLSSFDAAKVTDAQGMLEGCTALGKIMCALHLGQTVTLPAGVEEVWYLSKNTTTTQLPLNLNESIVITKGSKQQTVQPYISATKQKNAYVCGETLNVDDLTVLYYRADGTAVNVSDYTTNASDIDMSTAGTKSLIITYNGLTAQIQLTVTQAGTVKKYTVTFDTQNHGKAPDVYTDVEEGSKISAPKKPSEEGYQFTGWYKEAGCITLWNFETDIVDKDITLYAGWKQESASDKPDNPDKPDEPDNPEIPDGMWIADIKACAYTGKAVTPSVEVYYNKKRLTAGCDYTVTYQNNTKAAASDSAKAPTVIVKGRGNYSGTKKACFTISKLRLNAKDNLKAVKTYQEGIKYTPVVIAGGNVLKSGTDYTLTYLDASGNKLKKQPTKTGEYRMCIEGKGSCEGEIDFQYAISAHGGAGSIDQGTATVDNMAYGDQDSKVTLTVDGKLLKRDTDYMVSFTNINKKGTATATFIGIGNYAGILKKNFKVQAAVIQEKDVQVSKAAPEGANLNTPKRILHFFEKVVAVVLKFSK